MRIFIIKEETGNHFDIKESMNHLINPLNSYSQVSLKDLTYLIKKVKIIYIKLIHHHFQDSSTSFNYDRFFSHLTIIGQLIKIIKYVECKFNKWLLFAIIQEGKDSLPFSFPDCNGRLR